MPRDGSGVFTLPDPVVIENTTIESAVYNRFTGDVATEFNSARPIIAGGTGANNADGALTNVSAEKAAQLVTSYDTQLWMPGSFRSAAGAAGAPNATSSFVGTAYINETLANPPTNQNVVLEARDQNDTGYVPGRTYVREKKAGVWSAWTGGIFAAPFDAVAYNGMQINGSMEVSQENDGASVAVAAGNVNRANLIDGWWASKTGTNAFSVQQVASVFTGYAKELKLTITTAQASIGSDVIEIRQSFEGYRVSRLAWGTSAAIPATVGFWVKSSVAGSIQVFAFNSVFTTLATATVTITAANVAQFVTATLPAQTTGAWLQDNGTGFLLMIRIAGSGLMNIAATNGNTFEMTGLVLLPGTQAPTAAQSPLIMRPYGQEFVTCLRYYQKVAAAYGIGINATNVVLSGNIYEPLRAIPTISQNTIITVTDVFATNITQSAINATSASFLNDVFSVNLGSFAGVTSSRWYMIQPTMTAGVIVLDARL